MTFKISAIEKILTDLESEEPLLKILWSDVGEAQKELTIIKHTEEAVKTVAQPTLRQELQKLAPEILQPSILDDPEMLDLSIFSVCGSIMLVHAIQVSGLLRSFDTHHHIKYHLIEALKLQWEVIYYG